MAIPATAIWEIRPAGSGSSDANGGFVDSATVVTDYSQQDAPQLSLTDVVTNGTTTVTSVTGGFTAAMVGNGFNIAGAPYAIVTQTNTNTVTVDRNAGAATGQTGNVGGACATQGFVAGKMVEGNSVNQKSGAYTTTTDTANVSGGRVSRANATTPTYWQGYGVTRGDGGAKPIWKTGAGLSGVLLVCTGNSVANVYDNLELDGASLATNCCQLGQEARLINSHIHHPVLGGWTIDANTGTHCRIINCEMDHCSNGVVSPTALISHCYFHDCSTAGVNANAGFGVTVLDCLFVTCGRGVWLANSGSGYIENCLSYGCTFGYLSSSGALSDSNVYVNSIAAACTTGFDVPAAATALYNCASYANSSDFNATPFINQGFVACSANPFTNTAGNDFSLNKATGGGALLRAAGWPANLPGLTTPKNYRDIGPYQHRDPAGISGAGIKTGGKL